jgi:uncharacterized membrane protein YdjX (TVP38/TMEM64 family)
MKKKKTLSLLGLFVFILTVIYISTLISPEQVAGFTEKLGPYGPLAIIFFVTLGHVFLPMAGAPIIVASIKLYGLGWANIYLYFAGLISATANFWIARRLGRKWVQKILGPDSMKDIDFLSQSHEDKLIIMARLFAFSMFEVISYAAGLTKIRFGRFMMYTAVFSGIPSFLGFILMRDLDFDTLGGFLIWLACVVGTGAIFAHYLFRIYRQKNSQVHDEMGG